MNYKRIGRALICLLLISCLILNIAPPKVEATGAGLAATLVGASSVSVAAPFAVGAGLIALGVMAKNTNPLVFENTVNDAVASLSAAGKWVKDGTVELLQTIDEAGQKVYYVAGDMLENLRGWVLDSGVVSESSYYHYANGPSTSYDDALNYALHCESAYIGTRILNSTTGLKATYIIAAPSNDYISYSNGTLTCHGYGTFWAQYDISGTGTWSVVNTSSTYTYYNVTVLKTSPPYDSIYDLTLGHLPSQDETLTDTTVVAFHPYVAKALRTRTGGSGGSGDNGGKQKWWLGVALGATLGATLAQTQQQVIESPQVEEIPDISIGQEFDVEYGTYIETDTNTGAEEEKDYILLTPTPGSSPGTGTDPDPGSNPGTGVGSGSDSESTWFQKIIQGIEELPSKFESWITDCKTAIKELPSKFADWFNKIIEILGNIWELLQNLVSSLIDALRQLLINLFVPSEDFIATKVNSLIEKYTYLEPMLTLGDNLKLYFTGLGIEPPVIYIDLGAATGSYAYGGRTIFVDLRWYEQYKPTMDAIIAAFMWLWLTWRFLLSLPGIIQGNSGIWGDPNGAADFTFHVPKFQVGRNWLNSGSSYHKNGPGSSDSD